MVEEHGGALVRGEEGFAEWGSGAGEGDAAVSRYPGGVEGEGGAGFAAHAFDGVAPEPGDACDLVRRHEGRGERGYLWGSNGSSAEGP